MIKKNLSLNFYVLIILSAFMFMTSCNRKSASLTTYDNLKPKDVVAILDTSNVEFEELKARFKISADLNGDTKSFTADIRWEHNKRIWMSFSIFGIEGVRALITPDSIKVMNKLEKQYYYGDFPGLQRLSNVELSFEEVEHLLLGKFFGVDDKKPDVRFKNDQVYVGMEDKEFNALIEADKKTLSIQHYLITSILGDKQLEVTLEDYEVIANKKWPVKRYYNIRSGKNYLKVDATSTKVALDENLEYPFNVHPSYQRIPL